jgi:GTPase SAR1 family protein
MTSLTLSRGSTSFLAKILGQKEPRVKFNVWDFGGQAVFHSTHRFFMTANSLYVVLYDMNKPMTCDRLKYVKIYN